MSDRCPCGGIILADTEDWAVPLCYNCYPKDIVEPLERKLAESEAFIAKLIEENKWFAERMKQDE